MLISLSEIPHYASHVSFELYEDSETKEPSVQILYNNNPLKIASCTNGICTLPQFKTFDNLLYNLYFFISSLTYFEQTC